MASAGPRAGQRALAIGEALIDIVDRQDSDGAPAEVAGGSPANVALGEEWMREMG